MDYIGVREVAVTAKEGGKIEGIVEGKEEKESELVVEFWKIGVPIDQIAIATKLSIEQVQAIIDAYKDQTRAETMPPIARPANIPQPSKSPIKKIADKLHSKPHIRPKLMQNLYSS